MRRAHRIGIGLLALSLLASGCYGPFNLTRRLYRWNEQVGTKWEREFVFILLAWAPVYGIAMLGDAIVFNSMEFWTGKSPVDPPQGRGRSALPQQKRLARDGREALLTYTPSADGAALLIQQFEQGRPAGSLRLERRDDRTIGTDAKGRILFTAQSLDNGDVVVQDADGHRMTRRAAD